MSSEHLLQSLWHARSPGWTRWGTDSEGRREMVSPTPNKGWNMSNGREGLTWSIQAGINMKCISTAPCFVFLKGEPKKFEIWILRSWEAHVHLPLNAWIIQIMRWRAYLKSSVHFIHCHKYDVSVEYSASHPSRFIFLSFCLFVFYLQGSWWIMCTLSFTWWQILLLLKVSLCVIVTGPNSFLVLLCNNLLHGFRNGKSPTALKSKDITFGTYVIAHCPQNHHLH